MRRSILISKSVFVLLSLASINLAQPAHAGNLLVSSSGTNQVLEYNGTTGAFVDSLPRRVAEAP